MRFWSSVLCLMLTSGCGFGPPGDDSGLGPKTLKVRPCSDADPSAWQFDSCVIDVGTVASGSTLAKLIEVYVDGFPEDELPSVRIVEQVGDWSLEGAGSGTDPEALANGTHTLELTLLDGQVGEVSASMFLNGQVPGGVNESYDGNPDRQGVSLATVGTVVAVGSSANRE